MKKGPARYNHRFLGARFDTAKRHACDSLDLENP